jgi:hypothetical protein
MSSHELAHVGRDGAVAALDIATVDLVPRGSDCTVNFIGRSCHHTGRELGKSQTVGRPCTQQGKGSPVPVAARGGKPCGKGGTALGHMIGGSLPRDTNQRLLKEPGPDNNRRP